MNRFNIYRYKKSLLRNVCSAFLSGALLTFVSCATTPSEEKSSSPQAQPQGESSGSSKQKQAKNFLNAANRFYNQGDLARASEMTDRSLGAEETFEGFYLKGNILYQQGRTDDALRYFLAAEKRSPSNEQLLLSMGMLYTEKGELEKAQERYLRLEETYPDDPLYAWKAGTGFKLLRKYDDAYRHLKRAENSKKKFPYMDQLYMQLGDVSLERRNFDEADEYFKKAKTLNPSLAGAKDGTKTSRAARVMDEGDKLFKKGDYNEALKRFEEAKTISPDTSPPYLLAGTAHIALGDYVKARDNFKRVIELNPQDPNGYSMLGSAYHKLKDYYAALKVLQSGVKLFSESYEMHNKLGLVYRDRSETRFAIDSFYSAIKKKPDYVPAHVNLAFAYLDDKRYADAKSEFKEASRLDPKNADIKNGETLVDVFMIIERGDRLMQTGKLDDAIKEYKSALNIRKDIALPYNSIGNAELAGLKYRDAENTYKKSLSVEKNNIPAIQGLLKVYAATGNKKRERELTSKLKDETKNDVRTAIVLGRVKESSGKLSDAESYYLSAIKEHPDNESLRRRLGHVCYRLGLEANKNEQFAVALKHLANAKKFHPDLTEVDDAVKIVNENRNFAYLLPDLKRAEALLDRKKYAAALPLFEKVYEKLKRPLILVKIASCNIALGQDERGLSMLREAARQNPSDSEVSEAIYTYFMKKGDRDRARRGFEEIVREHGDAYFSYYKLGILSMQDKKYDAALDEFNRAIIYRPDFSAAYIARGVIYYDTKKKELAKAEFNEAMKQSEQYSGLAQLNLGIMMYNDNLYDKAEAIFREIVQKEKALPDPYYHLSYIKFMKGDLNAAETEIQKAIAIDDTPEYRNALIQIYESKYQNSRTPLAAAALRKQYEELIRTFPSSKFAEESRKKLVTLNPDSRVFQPYPAKSHSSANRYVLYNGDLISVEGSLFRVTDSLTKRVRYGKEGPGKIIDILADQVIHVLYPGRVVLYEPLSGDVVGGFDVSRGAKQLVGFYNNLGIVTDLSPATRALRLELYSADGKVVNSFPAPLGAQFLASSDHLFLLSPAAKNVRLQVLSSALSQPPAPIDLPLRAFRGGAEVVGSSGEYLLFIPSQAIYRIKASEEGSLKLTENISISGAITRPAKSEPRDNENYFAFAEMKKIRIFSATGKEKNIPIKERAEQSGALRLVGEDRLLYIASDRTIRMVDFSGKELWKEKLPNTAGKNVPAVFSLYY